MAGIYITIGYIVALCWSECVMPNESFGVRMQAIAIAAIAWPVTAVLLVLYWIEQR